MSRRTVPQAQHIVTAGQADTQNGSGERLPTAAGMFMALFLGVCLITGLANPALLESPAESLLDGSWAAAYQEAFDDGSPLFEPATAVWGAIEYSLFGQGRPGLLVGEDDWLFSAEEFAYPAETASGQALLESNLDIISGVAERLALADVRLLVAVLPAKARVYPEQLGRYGLPTGPDARYLEAIAGLQERGVPAVDLNQMLASAKNEEAVFLRTDTHWTPYGASVAAEAVADRAAALADFGWLDGTDFTTRHGEALPYRGDLSRYLPLGPLYDAIGPEDDLLVTARTESSSGPDGDLFAPVEIPVVLIGTSYSEDERWNFAGYLREALGSDVLAAARRGLGPYEPMLDYLAGKAFVNSPPQLIVWEIPERYLSQDWQSGEESE